jgi:hypothetical protein
MNASNRGSGRLLALAVLGLGAAACAGAHGASEPEVGAIEESATGAGAGAGTAGTQNVLVVNGTSQAVPVALSGTANVAVTNSPTVNLAAGSSVSLAGTPSVSIAGTPSVALASPVSLAAGQTVAVTQGTAPWSVSLADNTVGLAPGSTVSLAGTANVNVGNTVSVTGAVTASGTVNVGNPASAPVPTRDATDAAGTIVFQTGTINVAQYVSGGYVTLYTVPSGSRLIVDHISASTGPSAAGQDLYYTLNGLGQSQFQQIFPPTLLATSATTNYVMSASTHFVFEAGTPVAMTVNRSVSTSQPGPGLNVGVALSGRLVPIN